MTDERKTSPHDDGSMPVENFENLDQWTDALTKEGRSRGINRQCSIGWHEECSDPQGESCRCLCHNSFKLTEAQVQTVLGWYAWVEVVEDDDMALARLLRGES